MQTSLSPPSRKDRILGIILAVCYLTIALLSLRIPFFWDNITLGSQTAEHIFHHGIAGLVLPPEIDAGHPPLFGAYLALWWSILGPGLLASHLAMWPVLAAMAWSVWRLGRRLLPETARPIMLFLLLLEPTLLAQSIHVAVDLFALALFLLALDAMLDRNPKMLTLWLMLLCLSGLRGVAAAGSLWLISLYLDPPYGIGARILFRRWSPWILAGLAFSGWLWYHWANAGFLLSNPDSPWAENQKLVGPDGMLRNMALTGWRILDFGRVFLWLPLGLWLLNAVIRWRNVNRDERFLIMIFLIPGLLLSTLFLPFANPIAHRYFLPVLVLALPWAAFRIANLPSVRRRILLTLVTVALLGGHFILYPDKVAQGWDASLAHLPYFGLRKEILSDPGLGGHPLATEFPMNKSWEHTNPGAESLLSIPLKVEESWTDYEYVVYTNVINDIDDASYEKITANWKPVRSVRRGQIHMTVYQNPEFPIPELQR